MNFVVRSAGKCRVIIICLGDRYRRLAERDAYIYQKFYKSVDIFEAAGAEEVIRKITTGYQVVHILCTLTDEGNVLDDRRVGTSGSGLIECSRRSGVKLLWIASDNKSESYVKGFKTFGAKLNLVMTIDRNGDCFNSFLEQFISGIAAGKLLPEAWASIVPQVESPVQASFPTCIFSAGDPGALLIP